MTPEFMLNEIYSAAPLLVLSAGAMLILLLEVFIKGSWPRAGVTAMMMLGAMFASNYQFLNGNIEADRTLFYGLLYADELSAFVTGLFLCASIFIVMVAGEKLSQEKVEAEGEYYALIIMSTIGALIFANASELVTMFLGLETMSMALYCLCGSALTLRASGESALKYFLLGSFSSAFMLYGIALIYGLAGTTSIPQLATASIDANPVVLSVAVGLLLIGFLFKISAVPFHFWAPDVYQGAPTSITAYMATVIKASAVVALFRVLWGAFPAHSEIWTGAVWTLAVLTMTVGNLIALKQRSIKRMLAYSSIAHAGYLMVAFLPHPVQESGGAAILFYLIAYTAMSLGAFVVVLLVSAPHTGQETSDDITRFNSLSQSRPFLAALMALFMLALAGIPPGMAGFLGKFYIFSSAIQAGFVGIAIIGVLNSAVSAYYYLRIIVAMYFIEARPGEKIESPAMSPAIAIVLVSCAAGILLLGLFPSVLHDSARLTAQSFVIPDGVVTLQDFRAQPRLK